MTTTQDNVTEFDPKLAAQASSFRHPETRLDKRWVHKSYDENVLVSHIEAVELPATSKQDKESAALRHRDHFRAILCISRDHPFFFDRDGDHVHAICLHEAVQQTTIAIAHLFYGVPLDVECIQTQCSAQFRSMTTVDDPVIVEQSVNGHVYRRGRLVRMETAVVIRQGSLERARFAGTAVLLKKEQLRYLEERAGIGAPPNLALVQSTGCYA